MYSVITNRSLLPFMFVISVVLPMYRFLSPVDFGRMYNGSTGSSVGTLLRCSGRWRLFVIDQTVSIYFCLVFNG